jgi:hypothetical protein
MVKKGMRKGFQKQVKKNIPKALVAYAPYGIGCSANPRPRQDILPIRRLFQFEHDIRQNPQYVNCSNLLSATFNTEKYTSCMIHSVRIWTRTTSTSILQEIRATIVASADRPNPISNFYDRVEKAGESARLGIAIPNSMLSQYKKAETFLTLSSSTADKVLLEVDATIA